MLQTRLVAPSAARRDPARATDYALLKARVQAAGLLAKQPWYYVVSISANLLMLAICVGLLLVLRNPWLLALDAVGLGLVSGQLGFQLHDAGHRQMFERGWKNALVGFLTADALLGMSYAWWVSKHNRHHASPNHIDADPDVNNVAIVYTREQALSRGGLRRIIAAYQAFFFFPLLCLLGFSMHATGAAYLARTRPRYFLLEAGVLLAHVTAYIALLVLALGPWSALLVILVHKAVGGFYLATVFAPNHKGMPQVEGSGRLDFLRAQVLTSRNVRPGPITDFWYGSLNYQIEHHLFPAMPRNRVKAAHGIVKAFCAEMDVSYHETSMTQAYRELLGFLHEVGRPLRTGNATAP